jgi:hypothetical protein
MNHLAQVSVPLPPPLREFVRQRAAQEERSMAQVVRRLIAEAAARQCDGERRRREQSKSTDRRRCPLPRRRAPCTSPRPLT